MKKCYRFLVLLLSLSCLAAAVSSCGGTGGAGDGTSDMTEEVTSNEATSSETLSTEDDTTGGASTETPIEVQGLVVNIDINSVTFPFFAELGKKETLTEEDLYPMVDPHADTQVTDLVFDVFCQFSATPSDIMTDAVERHNELNSNETNPCWNLKHLAKMYEVYDIDPYEVWFKRTREQGMNAWLSIRMNDCHDPDKYESWLHGALFYEADEKGWTLGDDYGYYRYCLDYSEEAVRRYMLDYIREQLLRYNVDGLELDFSREMYCFDLKDGKDHVAIMNQFMRDVAAIVKEAEAKWDHDVKVNIRLMRDIEQNKAFGFDAETMAREKLVDIITISPRWATTDSDMPVEEWKKAFPEVEIYASLEIMTNQKHSLTFYRATAGMAMSYLSRGADKIYLYNHMNNPLNDDDRYVNIFRHCGSLDTLRDFERRYIVTYQDIAPSGYAAWDPLPARASGFSIDIHTGQMKEGETVFVLVRFDASVNRDSMKVLVNGHAAAYKGSTSFSDDFGGSGTYYRYLVPAEALGSGTLTVSFETSNTSIRVQYLEVTAGFLIG